jgi:hypothetical protein
VPASKSRPTILSRTDLAPELTQSNTLAQTVHAFGNGSCFPCLPTYDDASMHLQLGAQPAADNRYHPYMY